MTTKRIALTFDDGPGPWTEPILDTLAEHGARATFFVIGSVVERGRETLRRAVADGHEVGNHSWSHPMLARDCDDRQVYEELERTNDAVSTVVGRPPRRFRAPRYDVDDRVAAVAAQLGLVHTPGHVRPPDWNGRLTAAVITAVVLQEVDGDRVIGLHDSAPPRSSGPSADRRPTAAAVALLVPRLLERGFELVTASELLDGHSTETDEAGPPAGR
jgi:peptidoglycan-N-acetylglucosamine deacetylase